MTFRQLPPEDNYKKVGGLPEDASLALHVNAPRGHHECMARYRKNTKINSGGFGVVYRAVRVEDGEVVAFKELATTGLTDDERKRFVREVKIQAKLDHHNLIPILGYNLEMDPPWFVMPLARTNLRDELPSLVGNLSRVVNLFQQILDGVEHAHKNGVVHRDLKPENVLLFDDPFEDDVVKVADFGLGKRLDFESITITKSSENMGTAAYMPPEQFNDFKHVDQRGDIYALGKILYEMLTGRLPIHVDPKHPSIPGGYAFIISKCLEHEAAARYQSIKEFRDDFRLLTTSPKKFEKPVQRAEEILNELLGGVTDDEELIKELDELFQTHDGDELLYTKVFPRLPRIVIKHYHEKLKHRFYERVRKFDDFVSGSLPFNYTDVVADFYQEIYLITENDEIKRLIIRRLLDMGHSHNRYYVRSVLAEILQTIKTEVEALLARDILKNDCSAAVWCADDCASGTVLAVIADAFESCRQDLKDRAARRST